MTISKEYIRWLYSEINYLYKATLAIKGWNPKQVKQYMEVGEYSLALDDLADAYLSNGKPISDDLLHRFEALAIRLGIEADPEYRAIAELRARQHATTTRT